MSLHLSLNLYAISLKSPVDYQQRARTTGISLAVIARILLLLSVSWVVSLTEPLFSKFSLDISGRDLILLAGGLFLLGKATLEPTTNWMAWKVSVRPKSQPVLPA